MEQARGLWENFTSGTSKAKKKRELELREQRKERQQARIMINNARADEMRKRIMQANMNRTSEIHTRNRSYFWARTELDLRQELDEKDSSLESLSLSRSN